MKKLILVGSSLLVSMAASAVPITPVFDSFGTLNVTFNGTGIPNNAVAITTFTNPLVANSALTLGLTATPRFTNPALTNDGAGKFQAQTGADILSTPQFSDPLAKWNVSYYSLGNTFLYDFKLIYDFNSAVGNDESTHGMLTVIQAIGSNATNQGSTNMGFDFLVPFVPGASLATFNPSVMGEYTFALVAIDRITNLEVARSAILVSAVPEASTYAMMLAGLGAVGFVARRRLQQRSVG